jgi:hypothetical protein
LIIVIIFLNFKEEYAIGYNPEKKEDNGQGIPVRRSRNRDPRLSFGNHGISQGMQELLAFSGNISYNSFTLPYY